MRSRHACSHADNASRPGPRRVAVVFVSFAFAALRAIPGVVLSDEQGDAFQQDLAMRGFTASPVTGVLQGLSVFLDGVRVNEPAVAEVTFDLIPRAGAEARWQAWTASLRATNLFDHRYETFGTFAPNAKLDGKPVEPFLTPGPPLRIVAGLRWELG